MPAYVLDLAALAQGHSQADLEASPGEIGLEEAIWSGPIRARLGLDRSGDQVSVRADLEAPVALECARCLSPVSGMVRGEFDLFADRAGSSRRQVEEELAGGDYMKFHDGRQLDLRPEARETLLLELPMAPLCRPDCLGLCPRCGADLNQGPCGCQPS